MLAGIHGNARPVSRHAQANKSLWINGKRANEPHVQHSTEYFDAYRDNFPSDPNVTVQAGAIEMLHDNVTNGEVIVPPRHMFVMGDNRDVSFDGRYWGFASDDDFEGRPVPLLGKGNRIFSAMRWENDASRSVFRVRHNVADDVGIADDIEVEAPNPIYSRLPTVFGFVIFLGVQGWIPQVFFEEHNLLEKRSAYILGRVSQSF